VYCEYCLHSTLVVYSYCSACAISSVEIPRTLGVPNIIYWVYFGVPW